jgi:hypothetical protein
MHRLLPLLCRLLVLSLLSLAGVATALGTALLGDDKDVELVGAPRPGTEQVQKANARRPGPARAPAWPSPASTLRATQARDDAPDPLPQTRHRPPGVQRLLI